MANLSSCALRIDTNDMEKLLTTFRLDVKIDVDTVFLRCQQC